MSVLVIFNKFWEDVVSDNEVFVRNVLCLRNDNYIVVCDCLYKFIFC